MIINIPWRQKKESISSTDHTDDIWAKKVYTYCLTDSQTCKLSNLHDFSILSVGNYHPLMWSLLSAATHLVLIAPLNCLYLLRCTYTRGVIALSRRERGHPRGRTNVQNRMYRVATVKENERGWSRGASITIIILPHLKRWLLEQVVWKGEDREIQRVRRREMSAGKSLLWLLVNLKRNFIFQPLLLSRTSTQSIHTITKDISAVY